MYKHLNRRSEFSAQFEDNIITCSLPNDASHKFAMESEDKFIIKKFGDKYFMNNSKSSSFDKYLCKKPQYLEFWNIILRHEYRKFIENIDFNEKVIYLDFGCGFGYNTKSIYCELMRRNIDVKCGIGIDYSWDKIANASKSYGMLENLDYIQYDLRKGIPKNRFIVEEKYNLLWTFIFSIHDISNLSAIVDWLESVNTVPQRGFISMISPNYAEEFFSKRQEISRWSNNYIRNMENDWEWSGDFPIDTQGEDLCRYYHREERYLKNIFKNLGFSYERWSVNPREIYGNNSNTRTDTFDCIIVKNCL